MELIRNKRFLIFFLLYILLNVACTYLTTTHFFNPNIVSFARTPWMEISSFLGNTAILVLLFAVGTFFIKKERGVCWYLIVITFILDLAIFSIGYFTRNYKTMFSLHNFTLFRNPNAGFAGKVAIDALKELIVKGRIICFAPFAILLAYFLTLQGYFKHQLTHISLIAKFIFVLSSLIVSMLTVIYFQAKLAENWEYRTEVPQYGCQSCGLYNYYFAEALYGVNYSENYVKEDIEGIKGNLTEYDKNNKAGYVNLVNGQSYKYSSTAPLAGMNLFIIQAESLQTFVLDYQYTDKDGKQQYLMPYLRQLMESQTTDGKQASFVFRGGQTVVGLGNTSDAEFATQTGFYPLGDATMAWEAYDKDYQLNGIPKSFGSDYVSYSYNPTLEEFYAHRFVHENFYKFNRFRGIESFREEYPKDKNSEKYLQKNWISDKYMLEYALKYAKEAVDSGKKSYSFVETISPHLPFDDMSENYPAGTVYEKLTYPSGLSEPFANYLNQFHYNDKVLYDFILQAKETLPNTVFVIYGDHGNTLDKTYFELLLGDMDELEYRKMMLSVPTIFYDPSGKLANYCQELGLDLTSMLNRTTSQIDLYATILALFGIESEDFVFGTNMFSLEPSFAIDPKNLDIITDDFMYSLKNREYVIYNEEYSKSAMADCVMRIAKFKKYNDYYLSYIIENAADRKHGYIDSFD